MFFEFASALSFFFPLDLLHLFIFNLSIYFFNVQLFVKVSVGGPQMEGTHHSKAHDVKSGLIYGFCTA